MTKKEWGSAEVNGKVRWESWENERKRKKSKLTWYWEDMVSHLCNSLSLSLFQITQINCDIHGRKSVPHLNRIITVEKSKHWIHCFHITWYLHWETVSGDLLMTTEMLNLCQNAIQSTLKSNLLCYAVFLCVKQQN